MDPFLDEQEEQGSGFDPIALLRAFWRRKMLFFVPFVMCLAMAAIAIKTMTPIYASSGQIMINYEGLNSSILTDPSRRFGRTRNIDAAAYREMKLLLTSPDFLEKMVLELRLQDAERKAAEAANGGPLTEEQAIRWAYLGLAKAITLKSDGARLFKLEVRDPDPEEAYKLASYILKRFVEEYRAGQVASSSSTREFMQNQLNQYKKNLAAAEAELTNYQSGLAADALRDNPVNALNLGIAQENLAAAKERYNTTDAREMASLGQGVRALLGTVPANSVFQDDDIIQSIIQEMESAGLNLQLYDKEDVRSRDLATHLGQLRVRLNTRIEEIVARQYPTLSLMERNQVSHYVYFTLFRAGTMRVIEQLTAKIQEFRDFTARQPKISAHLAELQEKVTNARTLINKIETDITRQTMNLEASMSEIGMQIKVRQQPRLVPFPVEPDKVKLTLLGIILSLGIGFGLVMLAIFMDRSFTAVDDIERTLGLAVIGTLPVIQDDHFERKKKVRVLRWVTIVVGIIAVGAVGFLVIYPRLG